MFLFIPNQVAESDGILELDPGRRAKKDKFYNFLKEDSSKAKNDVSYISSEECKLLKKA